ncbi:hypothetical protein P3T76_014770 [Phytophthora citrophthora]|uniref:Uncharacterized protein n=1 Tax=Phytophthora citrophthora TaxID=4793 RepID=A0AAD9LAV8_9STRA|nr:hypothetical protein P3T76_014770 [Phytophthora citrophthora]
MVRSQRLNAKDKGDRGQQTRAVLGRLGRRIAVPSSHAVHNEEQDEANVDARAGFGEHAADHEGEAQHAQTEEEEEKEQQQGVCVREELGGGHDRLKHAAHEQDHMYVMYHEMTMLDSFTPRASAALETASLMIPTRIFDSGCRYVRMKKIGNAFFTGSERVDKERSAGSFTTVSSRRKSRSSKDTAVETLIGHVPVVAVELASQQGVQLTKQVSSVSSAMNPSVVYY